MSKDRDKRYQTGADFAEDLRRVREGEPILAKKVSVLGRAWRWSRRRPAAAALVCALALAIPAISGLGVWWWVHRDDVQAQERARQEEAVEDALDAGFERLFHGTTGQALEAFERALAADAGSAEAVVGLALTQLKLESRKAALQVIRMRRGRSRIRRCSLAPRRTSSRGSAGRPEAARVMESAPTIEGPLMWFLEGLRAIDAGHALAGKNRDAAYRPAVDQTGNDSQAAYRRAIAHLTRAVASSPRVRRTYHCQLAHAIGHGGAADADAGVAIAESLLELWPRSGTAWHFAEFALEGAGVDRGGEPSRAASRPDPGQGRARGRSKWEEILAESLALGSLRSTAQAYFDLGSLLGRLGRTEEAALAFRRSLEFKRDDDGAHSNLGLNLLRLGKLEDSLDALREALRLNPGHAQAHFGLGIVLARQGKLEEAIAANREAIRLDPGDERPYPNLAANLMNLGRLDEACPFITEAIRLNPRDAAAQNALGYYMIRRGRFEEAIAPLREAIQLDPNFPGAQASLCRALLSTGRGDEAAASMREAIRLDVGGPDVYKALGDALCERGRYAEGIDAYRRSLRLKPDNNLAYDIGCGLNSRGLQDAAADFFRDAIRIAPDHAEAHCNLAGILRDQGDPRAALAGFRRGHELGSRQKGWPYPSAQWVAIAEQRVAEEDEREAQLAAHLAAGTKPGTENELAVLAGVALRKGHRALAVEWFRAAFEEAPELAADLLAGHRRAAARAAVLASVAGAESRPGGTTPSALRLLALSWLEDEVASLKAGHDAGSIAATFVRVTLVPLTRSPDLASVRHNDPISKLPAAEQARWRELWADVDAVLASLEPKPETR